jgi:hypothetical protein
MLGHGLLNALDQEIPELKGLAEAPAVGSEDIAAEPSILFLGTVSMKPTMYRSASAIMVFINGHGLLMDCAEGSYG